MAEGGSEGQEDEEKPGKGKKGRLLGRNVEATRDLGITPNWRTSRRVSFCLVVDETPLSKKMTCVVRWKVKQFAKNQAPQRRHSEPMCHRDKGDIPLQQRDSVVDLPGITELALKLGRTSIRDSRP